MLYGIINKQEKQPNHEEFFSHVFGTSCFRECRSKLYRGTNASQNRIVCLCRPPLLFFSPPRLDAWCSPDRRRYLWDHHWAVALNHIPSHTSTCTPQWSGPDTQPECDQISNFTHALNKQPEQRGRALSSHSFPKRTTPPAFRCDYLEEIRLSLCIGYVFIHF